MHILFLPRLYKEVKDPEHSFRLYPLTRTPKTFPAPAGKERTK